MTTAGETDHNNLPEPSEPLRTPGHGNSRVTDRVGGRVPAALPTVTFPNGLTAPALGQGTWYLGERSSSHAEELAALRTGIELGLTMIDTAEMYGEGAAERLVGEAIGGQRDEVFLVSKVLPGNASLRGTVNACKESLRRLRTDYLDLYLLHWRGSFPLSATIEAFETLAQDGLIRGWGVSNFDADDMDELLSLPGGSAVQTNQVLYNLASRGPEFDLLSRGGDRRVPLMAYSPIDHGELNRHPRVREMAQAKGISAAQLAIAWVLRLSPQACTVVKASTPAHARDNRAAADVTFSDDQLAELDSIFPPPVTAEPLRMR
ncbi:MAG: oxidoreductase [Glaciihabitans sp.]|nr:oxidoreductase [Glaciihabitans sp.]